MSYIRPDAMSYIRTPAGTAAVLNTKVAMPRPLKALLIAMNGQFDPYSYASRLPNGLDVSAMLEALVKAGYVRELSDTSSRTVEFVDTEAAQLDAWPEAVTHRSLQDAVASITDFVMRHLPDQALEIVLALEGLTSAAQLEASLKVYEAKIRHLGSAAVQHLAKVKQLLHPA